MLRVRVFLLSAITNSSCEELFCLSPPDYGPSNYSRRGGWHKLDAIYTLFCTPSPVPQYRRRDTVGNVHTHNILDAIMVYHSVRLPKGICRILRTQNRVAGKQELDIPWLALGYKGPLGTRLFV